MTNEQREKARMYARRVIEEFEAGPQTAIDWEDSVPEPVLIATLALERTKLLISIEGGVVQEIASEDPRAVDIILQDYDVLEEDGVDHEEFQSESTFADETSVAEFMVLMEKCSEEGVDFQCDY